MTERVVAAALAALPRRRPRRGLLLIIAVIAVAIAAAVTLVPSGSGLPRGPLKFRVADRGSVEASRLAKLGIDWFIIAHTNYGFSDNAARFYDFPQSALAALDRIDFYKRFVVFVVRRDHAVRVRKLLLRRLPQGLQLCVFIRDNPERAPLAYGYQILSVAKTGDIGRHTFELEGLLPVIFGPRDQVIQPKPLGNAKPGLCR